MHRRGLTLRRVHASENTIKGVCLVWYGIATRETTELGRFDFIQVIWHTPHVVSWSDVVVITRDMYKEKASTKRTDRFPVAAGKELR